MGTAHGRIVLNDRELSRCGNVNILSPHYRCSLRIHPLVWILSVPTVHAVHVVHHWHSAASAVSRVVGSADHPCPYAPAFSEGVIHSVSPNEIEPVLSVEAKHRNWRSVVDTLCNRKFDYMIGCICGPYKASRCSQTPQGGFETCIQ